MTRLLSLLVFAVAIATVAQAMLRPNSAQQPRACSQLWRYRVRQGDSLRLPIPASDAPLRLASLAQLKAHAADVPDAAYSYALRVEWRDPTGRIIDRHTFHERAPRFSVTDPRDAPAVPITRRRHTALSARALARYGGFLDVQVVTLDARLEAVWLRLFRQRRLRPWQHQRLALAPSQELRLALEDKAAVAVWQALSPTEQGRLTRTQWRTVLPQRRRGQSLDKRALTLCSDGASPAERKASRQQLRAGRATAFGLHGPLRLQLSAQRHARALRLLAVDAWGTRHPVHWLARRGPTRTLRIDAPGPVYLHVRNPGSETIDFTLRSFGAPHRLTFGRTLAVPEQKPWAAQPHAHSRARLAPEVHRFTAYRSDAGHALRFALPPQSRTDRLRLQLRTLLQHQHDAGPRRITLRALGRDGQLRWQRSHTWTAPASMYEWAEADLAAPHTPNPPARPRLHWLSEPATRYVAGLQGVATLELHSETPTLLGLSVWGALRGDPRLYPLPDAPTTPAGATAGHRRAAATHREQAGDNNRARPHVDAPEQVRSPAAVRYRLKPVTPWHPLRPADESALRQQGQLWRIHAVTRIDPATSRSLPQRSPAVARHYRSVRPTPDGDGRLFLRPQLHPASRPQVWYCAFSPGKKGRFRFGPHAARALHGELRGQLWTPPEHLGQRYHITLDGRLWRGTVLRQTLTTLLAVRQRPVERAHFEGPPGSLLWLRTHALAPRCPKPHRMFTAHHIDPGARRRYRVHKTQTRQLVSFGGFARAPVTLHIRLDPRQSHLAPGVYLRRTQMDRLLTLPVLAPQAIAQDDAHLRLPVLHSRAIALGAELSTGPHHIEVHNVGQAPLYLRVLQEGRPASGRQRTRQGYRWINSAAQP